MTVIGILTEENFGRIGTEGVSVFTILSVDEDAHTAIIESTADAPGKYPFPAKLANLVPAT